MIGTLAAINRYPVKSMMGEELNAVDVTDFGLAGDRAYAVISMEDGKVGSAKNPKRWPQLFDFQARYAPGAEAMTGKHVYVTLPDGTITSTLDPNAEALLSSAIGRRVTLQSAQHLGHNGHPAAVNSEAYWPDLDGLGYRDEVTQFTLPAGTFFDCAVVHLVTTSTLAHLSREYPSGRFESRRFRPNFVIQTLDGSEGFVESQWIGKTLTIGEEVELQVFKATGRCVMTTLPQRDLPRDLGILRTAVDGNGGKVGVYATVTGGGRVKRGDALRLS